MDFALTDIQEMLKDSASKFINNAYDFDARQKLSASDTGYSEEHWQLFAELGWLALPFEDQYGGLDGTAVELMVLMETLGKGLLLEPYLSTVVLSGNLIQRLGNESQKSEWLTAIAGGEKKVAFAGFETASQTDITSITTRAEINGDSVKLTGKKPVVLHAQSADMLLVAAKTSDDDIGVFMVSPKESGVTIAAYPTNDGGRAADVTLNNVTVSADARLGEGENATDAIGRVLADAVIAVSAEAVGLMEKMLNATVEYTRVRKQFDMPIARFQVLQHKMVDMFVEVEQARSMLYYGAISLSADNGVDAAKAASMVKAKIGSASRLVGQTAVQLHGGMGVTEELDVGHMFKRLTMINTLFGSHDAHMDALIKAEQAA
ncbi:acyl-CoA dehydrogenase family protein [Alteromonas antoniana]|uniref:acyl-CoA dehydrogenase family protein n=1 Tax=Alteromonas antoniana TaxID=2803813 RepID=UPI001C45C7D0|nr:acyl-CoA dehydrogenase [Alteromonas antoniana]